MLDNKGNGTQHNSRYQNVRATTLHANLMHSGWPLFTVDVKRKVTWPSILSILRRRSRDSVKHYKRTFNEWGWFDGWRLAWCIRAYAQDFTRWSRRNLTSNLCCFIMKQVAYQLSYCHCILCYWMWWWVHHLLCIMYNCLMCTDLRSRHSESPVRSRASHKDQ